MFVAVGRVLAPYWALSRPLALRQLVLGGVPDLNGPPVAGVAEVSVAPAKPHGHGAAVAALEGDELTAVTFAVGTLHRATTGTD